MKHPIQPIAKDEHGTFRFKENEIVAHLLDFARKNGYGLNEIAAMQFPKEDRQQFAQLIGYSLGGYQELNYVDSDAAATAWRMSEGATEEQAKIEHMEEELLELRKALREPIARLYGIHPDDLLSLP